MNILAYDFFFLSAYKSFYVGFNILVLYEIPLPSRPRKMLFINFTNKMGVGRRSLFLKFLLTLDFFFHY